MYNVCMHDLFRTLGFPLTLSYSSSSSYLFIICADTTPLVKAQSCILSFLAGIPKEKLHNSFRNTTLYEFAFLTAVLSYHCNKPNRNFLSALNLSTLCVLQLQSVHSYN